jgi:hypothetical protein
LELINIHEEYRSAAACPSQAFADTPIGQSLLKLDESQRKCLESLFNTAYSVVKAGKPFSDYELICEIQVKNENFQDIFSDFHLISIMTGLLGCQQRPVKDRQLPVDHQVP